MELLDLSGELSTLSNPLLGTDFIIYTSTLYSAGVYKIYPDGTREKVQRDYEQHRTVKVYVSPESRLLKMKLKPAALKLWVWIEEEMDNGNDFIRFNKVRFIKETDLTSPTTLCDAFRELSDKDFIRRHEKTEYYWVNPRYCFMGNRMNKFSEYCFDVKTKKKKKTKKEKDAERKAKEQGNGI